MDQTALWLRDQERAMEDSLAELVAINSFTDNVDGGNVNVSSVLRLFEIAGLSHERLPGGKYADHLTFRSSGIGRPVALIGHSDTVFPPGTFEGYKRDGDLSRGPGVLDMKGGLVVVAYALRALAETVGLERVAPIRMAIVADEEVGSPTGRGIIQKAIADAASALVFESGRMNDLIITRRKGTGAMTACASGVAAHAGNNHKDGANAIWALARFVDRVQALTDYAKGVSINVGKIEGGTTKNTVPDSAKCELDLRFESVADAEALVRDVEAAAVAAASSVPGTRIELAGGIARAPLERTDASVSLMHLYGQAAKEFGLGADEAPLIGGGSDASTSSAMGIASIDGLGPRGKGFHTKDEYIERATLLLKAQALARFLLTWK